ncbi:MAG: DUF2382 domain-containing protein, partial [Spirulinaceae cyanobacterium]
MALYKIEDFYPTYTQDLFDGEEVKGLTVYAGLTEEKVGTIHDVLVDETGKFRYFVVDTGFWFVGKKVLLPMGRCRIDDGRQRIYATGLENKQQSEQLPEYDDSMTVDYEYEQRVRNVYRPRKTPMNTPPALSRNNYYESEPDLYQMPDNHKLRLHEERLMVNKNRYKTGEVAVGKQVTSSRAKARVPVERERVVIERSEPINPEIPVHPSKTNFQNQELARFEVHKEAANIHKEAFVTEEVSVTKEVTQELV